MAAAEIADITARGRAAFDTDVALRRALERCLEILGEAAKAGSADLRHYPEDRPTATSAGRRRG